MWLSSFLACSKLGEAVAPGSQHRGHETLGEAAKKPQGPRVAEKGAAARAAAVDPVKPNKLYLRKQELKKRSRNYVKHVRKVFLKNGSSWVDFCTQWGARSGAGWSPGMPDG